MRIYTHLSPAVQYTRAVKVVEITFEVGLLRRSITAITATKITHPGARIGERNKGWRVRIENTYLPRYFTLVYSLTRIR